MKKKLLIGLAAAAIFFGGSYQVYATSWSYNQADKPSNAQPGDYWERNVGDGIDTFRFENGKWNLITSTSQRREDAANTQNALARQREEEIDQLNNLRNSYIKNAMQNSDYYIDTPENDVEYVYINQITITPFGEKRFNGTVRIPKVDIPERLPEYYVTPYVDSNVPEMLPIIGNPYADTNLPEKFEVTQNEPSDWVKDQIEWAKHLENQLKDAENDSIQDNATKNESSQNEENNVDSNSTQVVDDIPQIIDEVQKNFAMFRLYNPNSGEHFYTSSLVEKNSLVKIGWKDEGISWNSPETGDPVYRVYNPNSGDHHFTKSVSEKNYLVKLGWRYEGISWYSDFNKRVRIHRLYNPNALTATHHYTSSQSEVNFLVEKGWRYEGTAWYGA